MSDDIWRRWDRWCKTKLHKESYRKLWVKASRDKIYADKFIAYINNTISEG